MLSKDKMIYLFKKLNLGLKESHVMGEIGLVGGAVMCLVFQSRKATKDIDALFQPTKIIRKWVRRIAKEENLPQDWLNDGAKGFIQPGFKRKNIFQFSHLRIWVPEAAYMLAMKCISGRWDSLDREDVIFLIYHLKIKNDKQVFQIIEKYYAKNQIPAKTQFFIEEIFESFKDD